MKISDALLYAIHKNGNTMTSYDLLNYIKQLQQYDMLEVNEDGVSFSLTENGLNVLKSKKLIS